jgi:hypothetical protein
LISREERLRDRPAKAQGSGKHFVFAKRETPQLMDNLLVMQKALKEMRAMVGQLKLVQAAAMH